MEYLPDVPVAAGERQTLLALLDLQRASITAICAGCSDDDLRARLVLSETSLLGIVKHLAYAERWWFQDKFAGREVSYPWADADPNAEFRIYDDESTETVLDFYAAECQQSRDIVAAFATSRLLPDIGAARMPRNENAIYSTAPNTARRVLRCA